MHKYEYKKTQPKLRPYSSVGPVNEYPKCERCGRRDAVRQADGEEGGEWCSDWFCLRCKVAF